MTPVRRFRSVLNEAESYACECTNQDKFHSTLPKSSEKKVAPRARFELATLRLTAECSTIELPGTSQVRTTVYDKTNRVSSHAGPDFSLARLSLRAPGLLDCTARQHSEPNEQKSKHDATHNVEDGDEHVTPIEREKRFVLERRKGRIPTDEADRD